MLKLSCKHGDTYIYYWLVPRTFGLFVPYDDIGLGPHLLLGLGLNIWDASSGQN